MSRCFFAQFAPEGLRRCDGPVDRHHVISQQAIKRSYPRLSSRAGDREIGVRDAALRSALRDTRNLVSVCRRHHDLFHGARFSVPRGALPDGLEEFAVAHGLGWALDRQFGVKEAA